MSETFFGEAVRGRGSRDHEHMRRALDLAREGLGLTSPNPMVGAVIAQGDRVVGEGWHEGPGTPHAEIVALQRAGDLARGATMYMTLEPCTHRGRTPPCAPAVIEAGIGRVVAAVQDPHHVVDGQGFAQLRASGVPVDVGVMAAEAARLIEGFAKAVTTGMPFVTLKAAASLDGKVAARDGSSRWITGEDARRDVHRLRAEADAVMIGSGTALADDPALTVRLAGYRGRQPVRIVMDRSGRLAPQGRLFDGEAPTVVATARSTAAACGATWTAAGAQVHALPEGPNGDRSLGAYIESLCETAGLCAGRERIHSVLIEGGPTFAWSAVRAGVVDRLVLYLAAKLVGGLDAPGVLGGTGVDAVAHALPVEIEAVEHVGEDLKVSARLRPEAEGGARS